MAQTKKNPPEQISVDALKEFGGDKRDRTADLLHAMQALSQLSYTPTTYSAVFRCTESAGEDLVEISGIEPLTSCMPCKRSPS